MTAHPHLTRLVERVRLQPPLPAAVVFAVDADSLQLALSGAFAGYLAPTLVGPDARVRDAANRAGLDISRLPLIDTPDDPRAAAERSVQLARDGEVAALIQGGLTHEELLAPVAAHESGLRTERRLSHATFVDASTFAGPLLIADAQLNVSPNLASKADILKNTIELAHAIGVVQPRVAVLAPKNNVAPGLPSTVEAAALKSMSAQRILGEAIVEGPITPDAALSPDIARALHVHTGFEGRPDILLAPTMECAVMVLRTLTALTGALAAGLVLGSRVPIVLNNPWDPIEIRMAGCVLASLVSLRMRGSTNAEPQTAVV